MWGGVMRTVFCMAMILSVSVAEAATYYKWVDRDGSVVYSDEPPQGVKSVEIVVPDRTTSPSSGSTSPSQRSQRQADRAEKELNRQIDERIARRKLLQQKLAGARKALEAARRAKELGEEPKPGERLANVGGGTRLGPAYFRRQEKLEADIRKAEQTVEALQRELRQLSR